MFIRFRRVDAFSGSAGSRSFFDSWKPVALLLMVPVLHFLFTEMPSAIAEAEAVPQEQPLSHYFELVDRSVRK